MKTTPILYNTPMVRAIQEDRKTNTRRIIKPQPNFDLAWKNLSESEKVLTDLAGQTFDESIIPFINVKGNLLGVSSNNQGIFSGTGCCIPNITIPYHKDDILWVRETWAETININNMDNWPGRPHIQTDDWNEENVRSAVIYKADGYWQWTDDDGFHTEKSYWKPSIHMPKEYARIFLKVKNVKVERLQDISEEDAIAEGVLKDVQLPVENFQTKILYRDYTGSTTGCADARSSFMTLWISVYGKESWDENPWVWAIEFEKIEKPENF